MDAFSPCAWMRDGGRFVVRRFERVGLHLDAYAPCAKVENTMCLFVSVDVDRVRVASTS